MPELPEVETVKNVLAHVFINRTIEKIEVLRSSSVHGDVTTFVRTLEGQKYLSISRIGKFLIFHLTNNLVIISHLRMEGKYYEVNKSEPNSKYARIVIYLDNDKKVCYDDSRCFGYMKLSDESSYLKDKEIAKLGPEPWDADINTIMKQVKRVSSPIKSALLSQELMTGLGNIYVDETLFASKIHPETPANKIDKKQWETIKKEASRILREAIESGGSTIKSYHPGKDIDGNFQTRLLVYGKKDEPCPNCEHPFRFIKVGGRGTTYCPMCQPLRKDNLKVAIFGKIASGKSEVLRIFKENKIPTLSSDEVVKELYNRKDVIDKINKAFNMPSKNKIDREELRNHLSNNPKDIKKIDAIVHPLVKQEAEKFFKEHNKGLVVMEVPLLFESKMDKMFDILIAVEAPVSKQKELLRERNKDTAKELEKINASSTYDKNKNKADFIIKNDTDLNNLNKKVKEIINKLQYRLD